MPSSQQQLHHTISTDETNLQEKKRGSQLMAEWAMFTLMMLPAATFWCTKMTMLKGDISAVPMSLIIMKQLPCLQTAILHCPSQIGQFYLWYHIVYIIVNYKLTFQRLKFPCYETRISQNLEKNDVPKNTQNFKNNLRHLFVCK